MQGQSFFLGQLQRQLFVLPRNPPGGPRDAVVTWHGRHGLLQTDESVPAANHDSES